MKNLPLTNRKKFKCSYYIPSKNVELFVYNYSEKTVHFYRNDITVEGICIVWKDNPFKIKRNKPYVRKK